MLKPKLIILDEIDSGLDVDSLRIVSENIRDYKKDNPDTSIIIITHHPKILEYLVPDYVHIVSHGQVIKTGNKDLAIEIEKHGYNSYINKENVIDKDKNYE